MHTMNDSMKEIWLKNEKYLGKKFPSAIFYVIDCKCKQWVYKQVSYVYIVSTAHDQIVKSILFQFTLYKQDANNRIDIIESESLSQWGSLLELSFNSCNFIVGLYQAPLICFSSYLIQAVKVASSSPDSCSSYEIFRSLILLIQHHIWYNQSWILIDN